MKIKRTTDHPNRISGEIAPWAWIVVVAAAAVSAEAGAVLIYVWPLLFDTGNIMLGWGWIGWLPAILYAPLFALASGNLVFAACSRVYRRQLLGAWCAAMKLFCATAAAALGIAWTVRAFNDMAKEDFIFLTAIFLLSVQLVSAAFALWRHKRYLARAAAELAE